MKNSDDEFVEKILRDLPKAPPMSSFEIKRFEKQIDELVRSQKAQPAQRSQFSRLTVAASIVALVAGVAIFANDSEVLNGKLPVASPSASSGVSERPDPEMTTEPGPSSSKDGEDPTIYNGTKSPTPGTSSESAPVLSTGIDYATDLNSARQKVTPKAIQGNLNQLSSSQVSCAVKLGIEDLVYAVDESLFEGENIDAYYYGSSKSNLKIYVIGFGCTVLAQIPN